MSNAGVPGERACVKAKGKNRGALRLVPSPRGCKRLRGWRPVAWSASISSSATGQSGSQGAGGEQGLQGNPGPEGKEGQQGVAGQVEKSLVDTIQTQSVKIDELTDEVANLEGDLADLEGTVGETCSQLTTLTGQSDEIVSGVTTPELNNPLNSSTR
jgi:hypothetical protein